VASNHKLGLYCLTCHRTSTSLDPSQDEAPRPIANVPRPTIDNSDFCQNSQEEHVALRNLQLSTELARPNEPKIGLWRDQIPDLGQGQAPNPAFPTLSLSHHRSASRQMDRTEVSHRPASTGNTTVRARKERSLLSTDEPKQGEKKDKKKKKKRSRLSEKEAKRARNREEAEKSEQWEAFHRNSNQKMAGAGQKRSLCDAQGGPASDKDGVLMKKSRPTPSKQVVVVSRMVDSSTDSSSSSSEDERR
jgi:hypothetical protein